ncbi:MAG: alkaline phosphatase family protein [Methylococcaceae bacterium]|nr:alkaline phosphatase family protein [Methylococcaceae bacterium]
MKNFALRPLAAAVLAATSLSAFAAPTTTPIKHLIVVIGENVSFDTLFGTYIPAQGQSVFNLLSQGIVKADGTPGANYAKAVQSQAINNTAFYNLNPDRIGAYPKLPQPTLIGTLNPDTLLSQAPSPDPAFASLNLNGPFQITQFVPFNSAETGDPVHRFFQMWQQTGGTNEKLDLFTWVAMTVGKGGETAGVTSTNTGQGGELMGFYNMNQGDAPYFKQLASNFALSDNYHQFIMGGTGANFFSIATGDVAIYNNNGLTVPPLNQIEDPNPQLGTNNFYNHDGYSGGSYVKCSDLTQPGVAAITAILNKGNRKSHCEPGAYYLVNNYTPPYDIHGNTNPLTDTNYVYPPQTRPTIGEALSKANIGWKWYTGGRDEADITSDVLYQQIVYPALLAIVPSLLPAGTSTAVIEATAKQYAVAALQLAFYNNIGDPLNASANVVNTPVLKANLQGLASLYNDVSNGSLPEVSFVVPKNLDSGHPGYSMPGKYESFLADLIGKVQANPGLWADTAILITTDEGGGSFDTGYIQNLDFFGDGPRIPMLVVSPYAKKGYVDHVYHDHASILKFIEKNWSIPALSARSRDNLPNPTLNPASPYRPANQPAVGDLTSLFQF